MQEFVQKGPDQLQVIAVQCPFPKYDRMKVHCLVVRKDEIALYTCHHDLIPQGKYPGVIEDVCHMIREDKYEWADVTVYNGETVERESDYLCLEGVVHPCFSPSTAEKQPFSDKSLRIYNKYLIRVNADNPKLTKSLKISLEDGQFRKEVEKVMIHDKIRQLNTMDKEIILRTRFEGVEYIHRVIKTIMETGKPDRFMAVNQFFRRLFLLEAYGYVTLREIVGGEPC